MREGLELLLDRALDEGGVNYGNRRIFGVSLEAIPGPTAVMLLACSACPLPLRGRVGVGGGAPPPQPSPQGRARA